MRAESVLMGRFDLSKRTGKSFPLLPVWIDDVDPDALEKGVIRELRLKHIQGLKGLSPEDSATKIIKILEERFPERQPQPRTPVEVLMDQATAALRRSALTIADLRDVTAVQWPDHGWEPQFARWLFDQDVPAACRVLATLGQANLAAGSELRAVLDMLAPFWLKEHEVQVLAQLALKEDTHRVLCVKGQWPWTVDSLIARAFCTQLREGIKICHLSPPVMRIL